MVVAVEFAFVFWATDYLRSVGKIADAKATAITALFFVGMATARVIGGRLPRMLEPRRRALLNGIGVAGLGFVTFWEVPLPRPVFGPEAVW